MKFVYKNGGWCELLVDLKDEYDDDAKFKYDYSEPNTKNVQTFLQPEKTFEDLKFQEGDEYEFSPDSKYILFYLFFKLKFLL
jgi:hypothetical protein